MNHQDAGIKKRVSEAVYPADILSDDKLRMCSLLARGAWYECLLNMWRNKTDRIEGDLVSLARLWGCSKDEVENIILEFKTLQPCDVTICNGKVTLINRRLMRRAMERKKTAERVEKHRLLKLDIISNGDVTSEISLPSSSSSSSSSISSLKDINNRRFAPPSVEEVEKYGKEIGYDIDGNAFVNSYEQKGWLVGKVKMKSWQAAVRNWKANKWGQAKKRIPTMDELNEMKAKENKQNANMA